MIKDLLCAQHCVGYCKGSKRRETLPLRTLAAQARLSHRIHKRTPVSLLPAAGAIPQGQTSTFSLSPHFWRGPENNLIRAVQQSFLQQQKCSPSALPSVVATVEHLQYENEEMTF